jgi:hypothetical protein
MICFPVNGFKLWTLTFLFDCYHLLFFSFVFHAPHFYIFNWCCCIVKAPEVACPLGWRFFVDIVRILAFTQSLTSGSYNVYTDIISPLSSPIFTLEGTYSLATGVNLWFRCLIIGSWDEDLLDYDLEFVRSLPVLLQLCQWSLITAYIAAVLSVHIHLVFIP